MFRDKMEILLDEIIKQRTDFTREKILSMVEQKKREIKNISDYTALLLVAIDLGVKLSVKPSLTTPLGKLIDNLSNVAVKGRVLWVKGEKKFKRSDGTIGFYVRAGIGDSSGTCNVVFWNRSLDALQELGVVEGNVIEITYASTRKSLSGEVELHVGLRSEIIDRSEEIDQFPLVADFLKPLSEVTEVDGRVHTFGQVINDPVPFRFTDSSGNERTLLQFNITDGNVVKRVVIWRDEGEYNWIKSGANIAIFNAKPKIGLTGEVELHAGKISYISPFSGKTYELKYTNSYLKDLKQGYNMARVFVRIDAVGKLRESSTGKKVVSIHVMDSTSDAAVTFVGKVAEDVGNLNPGDAVSISGLRVRFRRGETFIFCDDFTEVKVNPITPKEFIPPPSEFSFIDLSSISIYHKIVNVRGKVIRNPVEEELSHPFLTSRGEFYIEQNGIPAKISYTGTLAEYSNTDIKVGDSVTVYGALVEASSFLTESPLISLRLRAYSRVEKAT